MKLSNLFETFSTGTKIEAEPDRHINTGKFGSVSSTKQPHQSVLKTFIKRDYAYTYYIKQVVDNKLAQANPTFPRIFNIKKAKNGVIMGFEMEKLIPFKNLNAESYESLVSRTLKKIPPKRKMLFSDRDDAINHDYNISKNIKDEILFKNSLIKDTNILTACKIISKIIKSSKYKIFLDIGTIDIDENNIMLRMTSFGPQIVITDPFFRETPLRPVIRPPNIKS